MINKHKSNKIKENSNTVRHLNNGTDHRHSKSCCDQSSPARRTMTIFGQICTHEQHPIPRPYGQAMGCLSRAIQRKTTAINRGRTVFGMKWTMLCQVFISFLICGKLRIRYLFGMRNAKPIVIATNINCRLVLIFNLIIIVYKSMIKKRMLQLISYQ